jgi:hypothetical protein
MTGTQKGRTNGRMALCIIDHVIPFSKHNEVTEITNKQESVHVNCACFTNFKNSYTDSSNTCHLVQIISSNECTIY